MITYYLGADNFRDVWEALVLKHSLHVLLVLRKVCSSESFHFFIFVLKFGQPKFHASNVSNIKIVMSNVALEEVSELVELRKNICSTYEDLVEKGEVTCHKSGDLG